MGKSTRGKNLIGNQKKRGRCPVTNRTGVKLLYTIKEGDKTINVSKQGKREKEKETSS
jgi:hypothetical protein